MSLYDHLVGKTLLRQIASVRPRIILLISTLAIIGCGGLDQDDLIKYAGVGSPKDPNEDAPVVRPPTKPVPNVVAVAPPNTSTPAANLQSTAGNTAAQPNPGSGSAATNSTVAVSNSTGANPIAANHVGPEAAASFAGDISDTISPGDPLPAVERRQKTIANLQRIGQAIEAHRTQTNLYPAYAIFSDSGTPLLSWRVALLPYLGYQKLYDQFKTNEPWNSANNRALLAKIPSIYQSPERFDHKTNYLLPYGSSAAFFGKRGKSPRRWDDGIANTVMLLEVDDALAVDWTKPADYDVQTQNPKFGLGGLREDGFFVVWCDGQLARLNASISGNDAKAMFSVDGGEPFSAGSVSSPASAKFEAAETKVVASSSSSSARDTLANRAASTSANAQPNAGSRGEVSRSVRRPRDDFVEKARLAYQIGEESAAVNMAYIGFLTDRLNPESAYRWIPGLKRPAAFVRYGIALNYRGPNVSKYDKLYVNHGDGLQNWAGQRSSLVQAAGELAEEVLKKVEAVPAFAPAELSPNHDMQNRTNRTRGNQNQTGKNRIVPGATFLGLGESSNLVRLAEMRNVDVLILFDVSERRTRGSNSEDIKTARVRLLDVDRRQKVYESRPINYKKREHEQKTAVYQDPIQKIVMELEDLIAQKLTPKPIPSGMKARHAAQRVEILAKRTRANPLPALAEVYFYRKTDRLTLDQQLTAYQAMLIDDESGLKLLAGSHEERDLVLAKFKPRGNSLDETQGRKQ